MPLLIAAVKPAVAQLVKRIPKLLRRNKEEVIALSERVARQRSSNQKLKEKNQMGYRKKGKKK